jgi:hypothetical protein
MMKRTEKALACAKKKPLERERELEFITGRSSNNKLTGRRPMKHLGLKLSCKSSHLDLHANKWG